MKLIFLIFKIVFCSNEYLILRNRFYIVTDRKIKGSLVRDEPHSELISIANSQIYLGSDYFWDVYFPKPFMYELNCEKIRSLSIPVSFNLEGKTNNEELLFRFTLSYDLKNICLKNFVDSNDISITNALFSVEKHLNNIFMLSREAKNVENIKASYRYLTYTNKISFLYEEILHILFQYILRIDNLTESVKNIVDDKFFSVVSKAKKSLTSISINLVQNLSSLRFPIYYVLTDLPTEKKFENEINEIFKSLEDVVRIYLRNKNKGSRKEIIVESRDILDFINNVIIQDYSFAKCVETYKKLLMDLEMIENYDKKSKNLKINADLEILSDCSTKNVDEFIKSYHLSMLEYDEFMEKVKFENIFRHCFPKTSSEINLSIRTLEDFYVDKLISNKICSLIYHYEVDKTDFLIFSKTNYFAHIFSLRIINNLKLLKNVISIYDISNETKEKSTEENPYDKLALCDCILNAKKNWIRLLKDDKLNRIKSFNDLLKEEKLQVPILEKLNLDETSHSSETKEDQSTNTNIYNETSINIEVDGL